MRVLVCGGRYYADSAKVKEVLDDLYAKHTHELMIIEGGATGADRLASNWADEQGLPHARVDALWRRNGNSAGPERNWAMMLLQPQLVVAFPGGKGTSHMLSIAGKYGVEIKRVQSTVSAQHE
jgi:hypothetical protein